MKLAIITGGSRGIGAAAAALFLKNKWKVICLSRAKPEHDAIQHIKVDLLNFDIKQWESIWLDDLKHAEIISFVHCAGITTSDTIEDFDEYHLRTISEINVFSALKLLNYLVPFMKKNSSAILLGSNLSYIGVPNSLSYTISKHALLGLMRSISKDLAYKEIYSCCICPGFVETDMLRGLAKSRNVDMNDFKAIQLIHRFIEPKEIAELIYFCSEHPIVNGSLIQANLG